MCGVAGIYDPAGAPDRAAVAAITRALAHRGPDGERLWAEGPVCLGHRRLKILDPTEAAEQPMAAADGRVVLVYNGEVYNYVELRSELQARGHRFRSTGDTEVLLAAYLEWGETCFERLNGMFALALWDGRAGTLLLARDPFGIKQLYLRRAGRALAFASEPQALLALGPTSPAEDVVADYLLRDWVDHRDRRTFYAGIERLEAGTVLRVGADGERVHRFWRLEPDPEVAGLSAAAREERLRELFLDAVRIRLRSDVPAGTCLSGGVDSSAVVGAVGALGGDVTHSFTAWSPGPGLDERRFASAAAAAAGFREHLTEITPSTLQDDLLPAVATQGEPMSGPAVLVQRAVMRLAAGHVRVVLDGQGGDELFAGYLGSFGPAVLDRALHRRPLAAVAEARAVAAERRLGALALAVEVARPLAPAWLRDAARRRRSGRLSPLRPGPPVPRPAGRGMLRRQLRLLLERQGLPALLRYEDRASMANSIEARLPFLDPRLVRFAHALPAEDLVRDGQTKWILRRALAPLLPDLVRERRDKIGFAPPDRAWLRGDGHALLVEVLDDPLTRRRGYLDVDAALRLAAAHRAGATDARGPLWRALNLELWCRWLDAAAAAPRTRPDATAAAVPPPTARRR